MAAPFKLPKPEQFRLSPERERAIAEFKLAALKMGDVLSKRMAHAAAELKASLDAQRDRRP